jgi:hypothetical protein
MPIVPIARSIFLCDRHVAYRNGKVDLVGVFNAIRPSDGFPHTRERFAIFAQLAGGLGVTPFFFDIHYARTAELVWTTAVRDLTFPDRDTIVQIAMVIEGCRFTRPGKYIVNLICSGQWIADATLMLR